MSGDTIAAALRFGAFAAWLTLLWFGPGSVGSRVLVGLMTVALGIVFIGGLVPLGYFDPNAVRFIYSAFATAALIVAGVFLWERLHGAK